MANTTKRTGVGTVHFTFDVPVDPINVNLLSILPFEARVKSVEIKYVRLTREAVYAELDKSIAAAGASLKRHDAAVKANATRKAKKAEKKEVQNG